MKEREGGTMEKIKNEREIWIKDRIQHVSQESTVRCKKER